MSRSGPRPTRAALTLAELVIVVAILVVLAAVATPYLGPVADNARETATRASMVAVRDAIMGPYRRDNEKRLPRPGYFGITNPPNRSNAPQLRYLFVNPGPLVAPGLPESLVCTYDPVAKKGWRGPYLQIGTGRYNVDVSRGFTRDFGETGDPTVLDGWHNPIVLREALGGDGLLHAELRSAGKDGVLLTGDDIVQLMY